MKQLLLVATTVVVLAFSSLAQTAADSRGISFQGLARDNQDNVYASKVVTVTFTILSGPVIVYKETQTGLKTDVAGVFSTTIGSASATVEGGHSYSVFSAVDFSASYNIQVSVGISGGAPVDIGNYTLQAVPYAKYATNATHAIKADTATYAVKATKADTAKIAVRADNAANATHANNADVALNGVPVGTIVAYGGVTIPTGWLLCDGSQMDAGDSKYTALKVAIGNSWGTSCPAGCNYFNLPDLRGRFLRGVDGGTGNDPDAASRIVNKPNGNTGNNVGSMQNDAVVQHSHQQTTLQQEQDGGIFPGGSSTYCNQTALTLTNGGRASLFLKTLATGGNETRPKNANVYYIIKY